METENILFFLIPKNQLAYLDDSMTIRQAIEKMKAHSYMAIPLISKQDGKYLGTISEGDILWYLVQRNYDASQIEETLVVSLLRKDYHNAVKVDTELSELYNKILDQNFVPVVDDRGILMGIVTRKKIINHLQNQLKENED